jgi:Domain of unknown function (DUF4124)
MFRRHVIATFVTTVNAACLTAKFTRSIVSHMIKTRLVLSTLTVLAAALGSTPATAELYKWVDANGVVNYGDKPPASARNVKALDESSRLSIVPGLPPETMQRERERAAESRVGQLERELQESQARERAAAQAAASTAQQLSREREDPQVVLYPVVPHRHQHQHLVPPPPRQRPPLARGAPVERTKPQKPPAAMRADLPGQGG